MLKVLLKKQMTEIFRSYFYNVKTNKKRSSAGTVAMFVLFVVLMVGFIGGMFTFLSIAMCPGLVSAGMGWLFFAVMTLISIFMGAFGSVFNTYAGLYLSKDNDLLLSMPIPVKDIIASRLLGVYLLGLMYCSTVIVPAITVYIIFSGISVLKLLGGLVLFASISLIVLVLSCFLGWVVAKISVKLKNKSFITVIIALVCIGLYYFVYFNAQKLIEKLITNAVEYGEKIKGAAHIVYTLGRVGEGDVLSMLILAAITVALLALTWLILNKSFTSIATASGAVGKKAYREKKEKVRSVFGAVLYKEFKRFSSSPNYMLNCGLGIVFILAIGGALIFKGKEISNVIYAIFPDALGAVFAGALCLMAGTIDTAAPSVSLEGKSIWIIQSLPVDPKTVLRAKAAVQFILTAVPVLFAVTVAQIVCPFSITERIFVVIIPVLFAAFNSLFDLFMNVLMPNLTWTSEIYPIKQSMSVFISVFTGMVYTGICAVLFVFLVPFVGITVYYLIITALTLISSLLILRWLDTKGSRKFSML